MTLKPKEGSWCIFVYLIRIRDLNQNPQKPNCVTCVNQYAYKLTGECDEAYKSQTGII
jgi:hypothetical protein